MRFGRGFVARMNDGLLPCLPAMLAMEFREIENGLDDRRVALHALWRAICI